MIRVVTVRSEGRVVVRITDRDSSIRIVLPNDRRRAAQSLDALKGEIDQAVDAALGGG